jgi:hypothetical protein
MPEDVPMIINRYEILAGKTKREFPRFSVKERSKTWLGRLFGLLQRVTRQSYAEFTTTIFSTMYVGDNWSSMTSDEKYQLLRHEKKHIEQFHRWPFGPRLWLLNHVVMAFCYLFVLPVLWTLRAKFEREGYTQTLLVQYELSGHFTEAQMERNAVWLANTFGGPAYLFMWRRRAAYAWTMETQRRIMSGEIRNPVDRVDGLRVVAAPPAA